MVLSMILLASTSVSHGTAPAPSQLVLPVARNEKQRAPVKELEAGENTAADAGGPLKEASRMCEKCGSAEAAFGVPLRSALHRTFLRPRSCWQSKFKLPGSGLGRKRV